MFYNPKEGVGAANSDAEGSQGRFPPGEGERQDVFFIYQRGKQLKSIRRGCNFIIMPSIWKPRHFQIRYHPNPRSHPPRRAGQNLIPISKMS